MGGGEMSAEPPTEKELDMALTWIVINAMRQFFGVEFSDINEAEAAFLKRWRAIPAERRQAALDYEFPTKAPEEAERERAVRAMRRREV